MPEHIHLILFPTIADTRISGVLKQIKQPFSRRLVNLLRQRRRGLERLRVGDGFRVWQAGGGYDRNLFSPKVIWNAIEYLHQNPVRRGLVANATDWPWSSARYYELDEIGEFDVDGCEVFL